MTSNHKSVLTLALVIYQISFMPKGTAYSIAIPNTQGRLVPSESLNKSALYGRRTGEIAINDLANKPYCLKRQNETGIMAQQKVIIRQASC